MKGRTPRRRYTSAVAALPVAAASLSDIVRAAITPYTGAAAIHFISILRFIYVNYLSVGSARPARRHGVPGGARSSVQVPDHLSIFDCHFCREPLSARKAQTTG